MSSPWSLQTTISRHIALEELEKAKNELGTFTSPVLKLKNDARRHFDSVVIPLTNPTWRTRWHDMCASTSSSSDEMDHDGELKPATEADERAEKWRSNPSFQLDEVTMTSLDEAENVTGFLSQWLELDSPDDWVRHDCEVALKQEIAYASYLGLTHLVLPPPSDRSHAASYGRVVRSCLESSHFLHLSIKLPLYDPAVLSNASARKTSHGIPSPFPPGSPLSSSSSPPRDLATAMGRSKGTLKAPVNDLDGTWEMWDTIRSICGYHTRLSIALDLTLPLPSVPGVLSRWFAEPVQHVYIPTSTFIPNGKGYPVLPKGTQVFLQDLMKNRPNIILAGANSGLHPRGTEDKYVDYLRYLEKSSTHSQRTKEENTLENYSQGYQDYLQMPLQPLQDHLASTVYENFERDPVKYQKYEDAIYTALMDRSESERIVLTVAGAGRGPLVARSLKAKARSGRNVFIYAIEKNPSAYVTLQQREAFEWRSSVKVLFGDMRQLDVPEKCDILVSELLGSFGDNELSPECLDGAMRFLKDDGISIPSSYAAYLAPISSSKLHQDSGGSKDSHEKDRERGLETPYVVMLQSINFLSGEGGSERCGSKVQQCWMFEHPRKDVVVDSKGLPLTNSHNVRSATMTFYIPHSGTLHGFAGYFEAVLYGNIGLSIHPERKDAISKDMLSWFPCFFPIKESLYLPSNSELRVSLWRLTSNHKVWYEWYAESHLPVSVSKPFAPESPSEYTFGRGGGIVQISPTSPASPTPMRVNGAGALVSMPSMIVAAPSPMIDAVGDLSFSSSTDSLRSYTPDPSVTAGSDGSASSSSGNGVVKIGQTSLHNPGGRSSWYGL